MGKGIAKTINERFHVSLELGRFLCTSGNHVHHLGLHGSQPFVLFSFPTKTHWRLSSDLTLIVQSARELVAACDAAHVSKCFLPAPGCGCGGLDYITQVEPLLRTILDDRFVVVIRP